MEQAFQEDRLPVDRIEQTRDWFCGAACACMTTHFFGQDWDQAKAYGLIHDAARFAREQLYSDPVGMAGFINQILKDKIGFQISEFDAVTAQDAADNILRCCRYLKIPAICLTHGGDHWIVVNGIRYSEASGGERSYIGVYADNPWYKIPANTYIDIGEFWEQWFTPNKWGQTWAGKRVLMSDGRNVPLTSNTVAGRSIRLMAILPAVTAKNALDVGVRALESHGFKSVRRIGGGGAPAREPLSVTSDCDGSRYWIVALDATETPEIGNFIYAALAADGRLLQVATMGRELDIPAKNEVETDLRRMFQSATVSVGDTLKWGRHYQTPTRFDVYRDVAIGGDQKFYLRDMRIVDNLDMAVSGG